MCFKGFLIFKKQKTQFEQTNFKAKYLRTPKYTQSVGIRRPNKTCSTPSISHHLPSQPKRPNPQGSRHVDPHPSAICDAIGSILHPHDHWSHIKHMNIFKWGDIEGILYIKKKTLGLALVDIYQTQFEPLFCNFPCSFFGIFCFPPPFFIIKVQK
jgi:hypothetical protein